MALFIMQTCTDIEKSAQFLLCDLKCQQKHQTQTIRSDEWEKLERINWLKAECVSVWVSVAQTKNTHDGLLADFHCV